MNIKKIAVVTLVVLLTIFLFIFLKPKKAKVGGPAANAAPALPVVKAIVIKPQVLDNKITITGTIIPNEEVELQSEMAGKITKIHFKEGDFVSAGDVLVRINDAELQAQYRKAEFNKKLREDREERQKKLFEKDAISRAEYDNVLNELNTSNAEVQLLKAQLEKTIIKAPFSGKIGLRYVSEGSYINSNTKIATLTSFIPAKIDFSIPSRYSNQVKPGSIINFSSEGKEKSFQGKVYAVEPKVNATTRTLQLRATSDNSKGELLPGSFVKIDLILDTKNEALMVPTEAVIPEMNGHKIFLIKNGKVEPLKVKVGIRTENQIEILEGLSLNDTIISSGILTVKPGDQVKISEVN